MHDPQQARRRRSRDDPSPPLPTRPIVARTRTRGLPMQNDPTRDRELASARDDLQTIGRLGDVRHTWESISRHPGEDPLCSGREPSVSATVARLLLASDNSEAPCPPDAPWPASSCRGRDRQESRRPVIELAIACVANQQSDELQEQQRGLRRQARAVRPAHHPGNPAAAARRRLRVPHMTGRDTDRREQMRSRRR